MSFSDRKTRILGACGGLGLLGAALLATLPGHQQTHSFMGV